MSHPPERMPSLYVGNCAAADAKFYQRLGYDVLQPGEPLALPILGGLNLAIGNDDYPCAFYRLA